MVSCDLVRHTVFMLVSTLGFLFSNFYEEIWKTLVEDYTIKPIRNNSLYPDNDIINVIQNNSNLSGRPQDGGFSQDDVVCQLGYDGIGQMTTNHTQERWFQRYNKSDLSSDTRFQCMRVALDAIHWFVVCVDEQNKAPRHWDQSQIEHIYSWLVRFPDVGLIDLYPGNGFYALAAGALNRTSIVIESQLDNLQRIQKGMSISGLSKKVHLYSPKVIKNGKCASTTDPLQCGNQNQTINTYDVILSLNPAKKIILRARFDRDTGDMLMKSQQIFKNLCIPLVISEINNDLVKQNLTALRQLADSLVAEYGYRPFTYNGIALALNNIAEWPGVVYWMSKFDVE